MNATQPRRQDLTNPTIIRPADGSEIRTGVVLDPDVQPLPMVRLEIPFPADSLPEDIAPGDVEAARLRLGERVLLEPAEARLLARHLLEAADGLDRVRHG